MNSLERFNKTTLEYDLEPVVFTREGKHFPMIIIRVDGIVSERRCYGDGFESYDEARALAKQIVFEEAHHLQQSVQNAMKGVREFWNLPVIAE
jgi:hypothetical protein